MEAGEKRERVLTEVWDSGIRVLHWANALLIIALILLILGKEGMEMLGVEKALRAPVKRLHAYIGYIFVLTFSLRVIWGFIGNEYSRWRDIIPHKRERWEAIGRNLRWYLSGFKGTPAWTAGHDPLASLFYIAVFIVLAGQVTTGLLLSGVEFKMAPGSFVTGGLGQDALEALGDAIEEVHEFGLWFVLFFLCAHLAGLAVHEIKEKNGLFSSMIHGKKYFPYGD